MADLFDDLSAGPAQFQIAEGAYFLRNFANNIELELIQEIDAIVKLSPFRHMKTPGGFRMSVAMTNCGSVGWVTDRLGYRYSDLDPDSGKPWPAMPKVFLMLAQDAARQAGYVDFVPDACLVNCYEPGARMTLHQDKDEQDMQAPIVSVSLGTPATFMFGGLQRNQPAHRYPLQHGDVVVWGGVSRLAFHGIAPLKHSHHPLLGNKRINLTFRKAL